MSHWPRLVLPLALGCASTPKGEPGGGADSAPVGEDGGATGTDSADGGADAGADAGADGAEGGDGGAPVDADGDGVPAPEDCDDADPRRAPTLAELPDDGLDNDCDPATCPGLGFADRPVDYALPEGYPALTFITQQREARCADGIGAHGLRDLDGDGWLDLVLTASPCGDAEPGQAVWWLHRGGPEGFAAAASPWGLPSAFPAGVLSALTGLADCSTGRPRYGLLDLNGDGQDDLVAFSAACGEGEPGLTRWQFAQNTGGSGFAAPTDWALPADAAPGGLRAPSGPADCAAGQPAFALVAALRGAAPGLMLTGAACGAGAPGEGSWTFAPPGAAGFAAGAEWALPAGRWDGLASVPDCGAGRRGWSTLDLTGDGLLDLVETEGCAGGGWTLYVGDGAGFASAGRALRLPSTLAGLLTTAGAPADCGAGRPAVSVLALRPGAPPALIVTASACGGDALGESIWQAHLPVEDGWAEEAVELRLPPGFSAGSFAAVGGERGCAAERPGWLLAELTGDGVLDVVITALPCLEDGVGADRWQVYAGSCAP